MGTRTLILSSHKEWYDQLLKEDNTHPDDRERMALFFIISGNRDLYQNRSFIYNFKNHHILNGLSNREVDFSSGCRALIRLGFNLYNGYSDEDSSPFSLMCHLDERNRKLALDAISIRFAIY
ncbi:hypothetical protein HNQ56_004801 [Anaerotaenia torta]|uniref:DUF6075 family protein n=1 Tax=Anaerotaenia torta TaxID=433293 RepID=UPI003D1CCEBE